MSGDVSDWEGAKITFLRLLRAENPMALVHAGNAIEERVYALMVQTDMPFDWTPQFAEAMGGSSSPDIVVNLPSGKSGLIDVTSDRGRILGKAGPSISRASPPTSRPRVSTTGAARAAERRRVLDAARERRNAYGSNTALVDAQFGEGATTERKEKVVAGVHDKRAEHFAKATRPLSAAQPPASASRSRASAIAAASGVTSRAAASS